MWEGHRRGRNRDMDVIPLITTDLPLQTYWYYEYRYHNYKSIIIKNMPANIVVVTNLFLGQEQ